MKEVVTGNHTLSHGSMLCRAEVVSAYPITPQTQVVEKISELVADGIMDAEFIKVESEHSAMAACIGAAAAGARTFTATSAHGLALMHEMLHWAANARLPVIMGNINRAMGPPWTIWTDQIDSLSQRDTGWMQFYCESNQDVLDSMIIAYKVAENAEVMMPAMIIIDAFVLSHTSEPVDFYDQKLIDDFLPSYNPKYTVDPSNPRTFGGLTPPSQYYELKWMECEAMDRAKELINEIGKDFGKKFGREHQMIEPYKCDDAETVLIVSSTIASTAKDAVDELQAEGHSVGSAKVWTFRPFPVEMMRELAKGRKKFVVIDRNVSFGHEGIFCTETKGALYNMPERPHISNFIAGLGGRDVKVEDIKEMYHLSQKDDTVDPYWYGLKP